MNKRVDPELLCKIQKFGAGDWNQCFHCGNCTAVCSLTDENFVFPRKGIRYLQMGLKSNITQSVEPWLCYYCGDCSEKCLRQAQPGELTMSVRRYLMSFYDWTGLSKLFYVSKLAHILSFLILGIAIFVITYLYKFNDWKETFSFGHALEQYFVACVAVVILLPSVFKMYWHSIIKDKSVKVPFAAYFTKFPSFVMHFVIQNNILKCSNSFITWLRHWIAAMGYMAMLVLVVFFDWFKTADGDNFVFHLITYLVFGLLSVFSALMILSRFIKKEQMHKYSELSDWLFPIWLFLLAFTGLIAYLLRQHGDILNAQIVYIIHIIIITQWALLIVPFTKWAHILYRPFGIYLAGLKKAARKIK